MVSSGSLFFKKLQKKASPPPMSTAAEVRAASTAATSSDDRKPSAVSSVQDVRHPVAKDGHSLNKDRHPVAKDRAEKVGGRSSPKPDEKPVQRKTSEVQFVKQSYFNAKLLLISSRRFYTEENDKD